MVDEVFKWEDECDGRNDFELFWRKLEGPESTMIVQYGTHLDEEFTGIAYLSWVLDWGYTDTTHMLTCPGWGTSPRFYFYDLKDVRRDYCGWDHRMCDSKS